MDLSKLRNRSTPAPPLPDGQAPVEAPIAHALPPEPKTPAPRAPAVPVEYAPADRVAGMGNAWISLILGLLFTWLGSRFAQWAISRLAGKPFDTKTNWDNTGPKTGIVDYWELVVPHVGIAWSEFGMFTMGVALLMDGLILFFAIRRGEVRRSLVLVGAGLTAIALLVNLGVAGYLFSVNVTPIFSIVAVLVGGFMFLDHLAMFRGSGESVSR